MTDPPAVLEYGVSRGSGTAWSLGGRVAAQAVQICGFIALSRLVSPSDFGVMAAAIIFSGFALVFVELGIGPAVVARRPLTERFLSTAFWVNLTAALALATILAPLGTPLAAWFGYDELVWVVPLVSLSLAFSFSPVCLAILERGFRFKAIACMEIAAALSGQGVALLLATGEKGLLGLALAPVVSAGMLSTLALASCGWLPRFQFDRSEARSLRAYAGPLVGANVVNYWARAFDNLLVGKAFGPSALGYYARAYQLMLAPVMQATLAMGRVYQAAFASDADRLGRLESRYRLAEGEVALFGFLVTAVLAPNSVDIVLAAFGPDWAPMGSLLAIFSLAIGPQVITSANGAALRATGNTRLLFRLALVNSLLLIVMLSVAATRSVETVAWAFVAHSVLVVPITIIPVVRRLGFSGSRLAGDLTKALAIPALLVGCLYGARLLADDFLWAGVMSQLVVLLAFAPVVVLVVRNSHRSLALELSH